MSRLHYKASRSLAQIGCSSIPPQRGRVRTKNCNLRSSQPLLPVAEPCGSQKQSQLKRHVDAGETVLTQLRARQIMDAPLAIPNEPDDFFDSDSPAVRTLQGT